MDYIMDILDIILRSIVSIAFLFLITRLMGRKQISQLSFFDYIIGISIGSIAAEMAISQDVLYIHGFVGMFVYAIIAVAISIATNKSLRLRRFINGRVYILIDNGKILNKNLDKVRYDVNDLLSEARYAGYFNIADIEYALMETSGRISFMPKSEKAGVINEDLNIQKPQEYLVANIIIDGNVMKENLKKTGLNDVWLKNNMDNQKVNNINEVLLATVDQDKNLSIYLKSDKLEQKTFID